MTRPATNKAARPQAAHPRAFSYIRFSSPEQEKGDSLRRQVEAAREFAEARGLTLDDQLRMTDRGLSAYKGRHRDEGAALGEFLRLVEAGEIPHGSLLIVESLDRLSREQVPKALRQFLGIIEAGVRLVTLHDGQEYTESSVNEHWTQLIISITYMARAHEESATKAKRTSAAWTNKRERAANDGRPMTHTVPAWIDVEQDAEGRPVAFHLNEHRAATVERIFRLKLDGVGSERIARLLNEDPASWKPENANQRTSGWRHSYTNKILRSRTVIGELPPPARHSNGEAIPGYYPAAVDPDLFERVQRLLSERSKAAGQSGGRVGNARNLFPRLMVCARCGGRATFENKGPRERRGREYVRCDTAHRGRGCTSKRVPYPDLEEVVLQHCRGLDVAQVLDDRTTEDDLARLRRELAGVEAQQQEAQARVDRYLDAIGDEPDSATGRELRERADAEQARAQELGSRREDLAGQVEELGRAGAQMQQQLDDLRALTERMESLEGEELIQLRLRLRQQLAGIIDYIEVDTQERTATLWLGPRAGTWRRRFHRRIGW